MAYSNKKTLRKNFVIKKAYYCVSLQQNFPMFYTINYFCICKTLSEKSSATLSEVLCLG